MQRISLAWFASLGSLITPLSKDGAVNEISLLDVYRIKSMFDALEGSRQLDIKASRPIIREVLTAIEPVATAPFEQQQEQLNNSRWAIWLPLSRLEPILMGELAVQPVYQIWRKRAYDIEALVGEGETIFSDEVRSVLNEDEVYNIREAAKCLALEVPTAAAFHVVRCAESIIRRYYEVVIGSLPKPKMRNWGVYIRNLREAKADDRIVTLLEQIKDFHRNPVIHPEFQMDTEEALSLVAIIDSAMHAIVRDMKRRLAEPQLPFPEPEPKPEPNLLGPSEQVPAA